METVRLSLLLRIPELSQPHVRMLHSEIVCDKLRKMAEDGFDKLQIVADFDHTLTKSEVDGDKSVTLGSMYILKNLPGVPKNFMKEAAALVGEYASVMGDEKISGKEKQEKIEIIFNRLGNEVLTLIPIADNSMIVEATAKSSFFPLRDRLDVTLNTLKEHNIPLTIVSAGFGDVVDTVLKTNELYHSNINVVANYMKYKDGYIAGFSNLPVHMYNKCEHFLKSETYIKEKERRKNIILLGDLIPDSYITNGVPDSCNVLKIGFYHKLGGKIENYMKKFDIVLVHDESYDVVQGILKYIQSSSKL